MPCRSFVCFRFLLALRQWCLIHGFEGPELNCLLSLFKLGRMGLSLVLTPISFSSSQKEPAGSTVAFGVSAFWAKHLLSTIFLTGIERHSEFKSIFISDSTLPCHRTTSWPWNFVSQQVIKVTTLVWTLPKQHIKRVFTF